MSEKSNLAEQLSQIGWSVKLELFANEKLSLDAMKKRLLDSDLRTYGEKSLPDLSKLDQTAKPYVVQLHKTRNVTAPKDNESSSHRAHLYRLIITDGQTFQNALILPSLRNFSFDTPPGVKLLIKPKTKISSGFYLLNDRTCEVLGGNVEELAQKWKLARLMGKHVRTLMGEGAPPPWVPFGTRMNSANTVDTSQRAMDVAKFQQNTEEDPEFVRQRRAAIDGLVTGQISKIERFGRQNVFRGENFAKTSQRAPTERATPAPPTKTNSSAPVKTTSARLPEWAKNQIADEPSNDGKQRVQYGRNRRNRDDDDGGQETKPSKDVTLFDFFDAKPKATTSKANTDRVASASSQVSQKVQKQIFPYSNGDQVFARYAEDNEYYPAIIINIMHDRQKCTVMFEGYENEEIVTFDDVEPFEEEYFQGDEQEYYQASAAQGYASNYNYPAQQQYSNSNRNRPNSSQQGHHSTRYYQ